MVLSTKLWPHIAYFYKVERDISQDKMNKVTIIPEMALSVTLAGKGDLCFCVCWGILRRG